MKHCRWTVSQDTFPREIMNLAGTMIVVFCDTKIAITRGTAHTKHLCTCMALGINFANLHKLTCRETLAIKTALEGSGRA